MSLKPCGQLTQHDPHPWGWLGVFAKECPGLTDIECPLERWHGPHWVNATRGELCRGVGLAAICEHGVGMLDECLTCAGSPNSGSGS